MHYSYVFVDDNPTATGGSLYTRYNHAGAVHKVELAEVNIVSDTATEYYTIEFSGQNVSPIGTKNNTTEVKNIIAFKGRAIYPPDNYRVFEDGKGERNSSHLHVKITPADYDLAYVRFNVDASDITIPIAARRNADQWSTKGNW